MKCDLCGGWKTPVYLGELVWHCSPCGVKQYQPASQSPVETPMSQEDLFE